MKNLILFILLNFSFSFIAYSQYNTIPLDSLINSTEKNDSVARYYRYVYKAEDFMMKGEFEKAAESFEKAFTYIEIPFLADLGHARICELKSRKDETCIKKYIYHSIRKTGLKNGYLTNDTYKDLENWPDIKAMIDTLSSCNDTAIVAGLERIHYNDQDYRKQCNKKYNGQTYNEFTIDSIRVIDSVNYSGIYNIVKNLDYISEEIIGYKGWGAINIVLMHNRDRKEIYSLLYRSVVAGKLDARLVSQSLSDAGYHFDGRYTIGNSGYGLKVSDDCYLFFRPTIKENLKVNKIRDKLYLENISDYHKKIIWQMQNKDCGFTFYTTVTMVMNQADINNLIINKVFNGKKIKNIKLFYRSPEIKDKMLDNARAWQKEQNELKKSGKK